MVGVRPPWLVQILIWKKDPSLIIIESCFSIIMCSVNYPFQVTIVTCFLMKKFRDRGILALLPRRTEEGYCVSIRLEVAVFRYLAKLNWVRLNYSLDVWVLCDLFKCHVNFLTSSLIAIFIFSFLKTKISIYIFERYLQSAPWQHREIP